MNTGTNPFKVFFKMFRPKQWPKSMLVFAAPMISGEIVNWSTRDYLELILVFSLFVGLSSGIYIFNDLLDAEADRTHPTKRYRPIAAGEISPSAAAIICVIVVILIGIISLWSSSTIRLILVTYLVVNILYSTFLKRIPFWEMFAVSSGFVLRTVAGASLVQRSPSAEFLVIVLLGSLFIVASKRLSEIKNSEMTPRKVTNDYTKDSLSRLLLIFSTLIIATYFLFVSSSYFKQDLNIGLVFLYLSVIPFTITQFSILNLAEEGLLEAPEKIFWSINPVSVNALLWFIAFTTYSILEI